VQITTHLKSYLPVVLGTTLRGNVIGAGMIFFQLFMLFSSDKDIPTDAEHGQNR
jgi:hypothetical protein